MNLRCPTRRRPFAGIIRRAALVVLLAGAATGLACAPPAEWVLEEQTVSLDPQRIEGRGADFIEWTTTVSQVLPQQLNTGDTLDLTVTVQYSYGADVDGLADGRPKRATITIGFPGRAKQQTWDLVPNYCLDEPPDDLPDSMAREGTLTFQAKYRIPGAHPSRTPLEIDVSVLMEVYCFEPEAGGRTGIRAVYRQIGAPPPVTESETDAGGEETAEPEPVPPVETGSTADEPAPRTGPDWLLILLGGTIVIILILLAVVVLVHRRSRRIDDDAPPATKVHATLDVFHHDGRREIHTIETALTHIGRESGNDLVIIDPDVSRRHVRISATDEGLLLTDLESSNGTAVNGIPAKNYHLRPGDEIRIGSTRLVVGR